MRVTPRVILGALFAAVLLAPEARSQARSEVGISGRITGPDGAGVQHVLVRARGDGRVVEARTDENGDYRLAGAAAGTWTITLRRIGYAADSASVQLTNQPSTFSRQLELLVARVGEQRITASWLGVHGVVGDRDYQPVAAATVEVVGHQDEVLTSQDGQFAMPRRAGAAVLLRVRAPGFQPRLVSALIPDDGAVELSVLLDSAGNTAPNEVIADELDRRMGWASPNALYITRAELLATDAQDLGYAINLTPAAIRLGRRVAPNACVFVDGVPKPSVPLGALRPENIEFVEVYVGDADRTGQLSRRWPPRGECGLSGASNVRPVNSSNASQQYIVVWTRKN